jgi:hypothetical protein
MAKYRKGDKVRWLVDLDENGAEIVVDHFISGSGSAYAGVQLPEHNTIIFYENEVEPVEMGTDAEPPQNLTS